MGVTGLWRLIEPAGKPVPVETLENKVLAVDISIWLHQVVKGYQDAKGAPLPNAHLMGLFQRLCKLLYFRIKPVFVFDGAFPDLKKETIAKRQDHKAKYNSESERIKRELALLLGKKTAVNSLLGKQISPKKSTNAPSNNDDIFKLPALPQREEESESESEEETSSDSIVDLHSMDIESDTFKNKSVKEKYELLIELKETRKMNSWGRLHELPKKSDSFSDFQMKRLLKRRKVQECLEETEKEMGDSGMSINELESLLNEEGIDTKIDFVPTRRIASNETTRFLLIKDVKQALADAKKKKEEVNKPANSKVESEEVKSVKVDELEDDLQKALKMSLECVDDPNVSATTSKTDESWTSCMTDTEDSHSYDSEEEDGFEQSDMSSAKAYIMQYSDFTHKTIEKLVTSKKDNGKSRIPKVNEILEEINKENSAITDNIYLLSSDEESREKTVSENSETENAIKQNSFSGNLVSPAKDSIDATQSSAVVCVENVQAVINLDISTDENMDNQKKGVSQHIQVIQKSDSSADEFEVVSEIKVEPVTQPSKNLQNSQIITQVETHSNGESDSSDNEFEEVPEVVNKQVVELTLNMGGIPENDIFADIFEDKKQTISKNSKAEKDDFKLSSNNIYNGLLKSNVNNAIKNKLSTNEIALDCTSKEVINVTEDPNKIQAVKTSSIETTKNEKEHKYEQRELLKPTEKVINSPKEVLNTEKLNSLVEEMQSEEQDLLNEKGRLDRVGRNITEQMTKEAQELLQIFGIPYIVAPMEAEAQCAFLETANLTDGTITDDSDIWLFGGRTVYKNFFNQKKHVLQFLADRIEKSFNMNREQLVLLALLVGSDYTTGVTGVGPVTAMEILASFPFNKRQLLNETSTQAKYTQMVKGLQEFKQWVRAGKRTDNTSLKKKLKNIDLTEEFPSVRVVQAYLEPNVEKSEDKFTWGELDITILRDYTKSKFGWSQNKLDEIIKPVLKRLQDRKTQRSVQDFFKRKVEFQSLDDQMSKRVKAAVEKMDPGKNIEIGTQHVENKPVIKRKTTKTSDMKNKAGPSSAKQRKENEDIVLIEQGVKIVAEVAEGKSDIEIKIPKSDRFQEIIPQREKEKQSLLENKLKAIELFRKTNIDKKRKYVKRRGIKPKEKAELSESDSD